MRLANTHSARTNRIRLGRGESADSWAAIEGDRGRSAAVGWPRVARRVALVLVAGLALGCAAELRGARCLRVIDGDSLVLRIDGERVECRLLGIDAPERSQPFSRAASRHLESLVLGVPLEVEITGRDGFGRALVRLRRGELDVNLEMVRQGYAWHFTGYSSDRELARAEAAARADRRGLWRDPAPVPPWEHRRAARPPTGRATPRPGGG